MYRRRHPNWPVRFILLTTILVVAAYLVAPLVFRDSARPLRDYEIIEALTSRGMTAVLVLWLFALGATIGSFLNVVVYRMPAGETLIWKPSRCPYCRVQIQARDNVPVLGWLMLRGRCRVCRLPISPRYPLVEFVMGSTVLSLATAELLLGGVNLPNHVNIVPILDQLRTSIAWPVVALFGYHVFLLSTLLVAGLITFDGQRVPRRLVVFTVACVLAAPLLWPAIDPVYSHSIERLRWTVAMLRNASIGGAAGIALGWFFAKALSFSTTVSTSRASVFLFGIVGLTLHLPGLLATTIWAFLVATLLLITAFLNRRLATLPYLSAFVACLLFLLTWRWMPGP